MHSNLIPASARRRGYLAAGLGAGAALVASVVVAGSGTAFATDASVTPSASAKVDNHMWAVVDGEGGGLFGSDHHVLTSFKLAGTLDGQGYRLNFDRDLRDCAFVATPTAVVPGDIVDADTGIAIVQNPSFATRQSVDVITKDGDGAPVFDDSSFSLLVEC